MGQHHKVAGASNNATVLKNAPGTLSSVHIFNASAAIRYVKFYDKPTLPAPATDAPVKVYGVPAGGNVTMSSLGAGFLTGIGYATVTGIADNDNTPVAAADLVLNLDFF
jgi:hypothetical protein